MSRISSNPSTTPATNVARGASAPSTIRIANVPLFVANLRLLDLHSRFDYPDIDPSLFEAKYAAQTQKKRLAAVEWSLYRLFEIYDPATTKNKLAPFFPPLEPLQSINLRAALFRCLTELKKNGTLGREVVLRKTMMDDCKGEKFEELLMAFSSIVVRQIIARKSKEQTRSRSMSLALDPIRSGQDVNDMETLTLASRADLCRVLRKREMLQDRLRSLRETLSERDERQQERRRQVDALRAQVPNIKPQIVDEMSSKIQVSWNGKHEDGLSLVYGKASYPVHRREQFADLWRTSIEGANRTTDVTFEGEANSTLSLEHAIHEHRNRIARWKALRERTSDRRPDRKEADGKATSQDEYDLKSHKNIRPANQAMDVPDHRSPNEHEDIIAAMHKELEGVGKVKSDFSDPKHSKSSPQPSEIILGDDQHPTPSGTSQKGRKTESSNRAALLDKRNDHTYQDIDDINEYIRDRSIREMDASTGAVLSHVASPSDHPKLQQLDGYQPLTERTRASMGSNGSPQLLESSPSPDISSPLARKRSPPQMHQADENDASQVSLIEATRQSIAASMARATAAATPSSSSLTRPASKRVAKYQVQHGRSRSSITPMNHFETPKARKSPLIGSQDDNALKTPVATKASIEDDADMESVFKSRPKIAATPLQSSFWGDDD